ncbi:MAG: saccharopine dehydrogenase [Armatimonadia bacterium]|nr:saccharopine dehydrogenase [Armatimonadia bacterium]
MKVLCIGGAGAICREAVYDLLQYGCFDSLTISDLNSKATEEVAGWLGDDRVRVRGIDLHDRPAALRAISGYDFVIDGTPISVNDRVIELAAEAGVSGINLNGLSREWEFGDAFKACRQAFVPGFGMTPGVTNLLAMKAATRMETVSEVYISHGAFRPIAFSRAICETTVVEYDPGLKTRTVYEDGEFVQVPPFARPREVELPEPFGTHPQYIIPHPEAMTLSRSLAGKGVRLIEVRGTWPPRNMELLRVLYDWGMLSNPRVTVDGAEVGVLDVISEYLLSSEAGTITELYGYSLHVEVMGTADGKVSRRVLTTTHPPSDGSVPEWAGLRAYTRSVGIAFAIGADLMMRGRVKGIGTLAPETAFDPDEVLVELSRRRIRVQEKAECAPLATAS